MAEETTGQPGTGTSTGTTPAAKKLAGKYSTAEELEQGYLHQFNETNKIIERSKKMEVELAAVKSLLGGQSVGQGGNAAPQRKTSRDQLNEALVPVDALDEFVGSAVERAVAKALRPLAEGARARQTLVARYPDFPAHEGEVAQFLEANPEYGNRYQALMDSGHVGEAMELAITWYNGSRPKGAGVASEDTTTKGAASVPGNTGTAGAGQSANSLDARTQRQADAVAGDNLDAAIASFLGDVPSVIRAKAQLEL